MAAKAPILSLVHMSQACLRCIPALYLRRMRTLIANSSPVSQAVARLVGGVPGELTRVQLSRQVAGKAAVCSVIIRAYFYNFDVSIRFRGTGGMPDAKYYP